MAEPIVRPAGSADVEAIVRLEAAAFADPWSRGQIEGELVHPQALVLVAGRGAEVWGYAALRHGGGEGEILRLAVAPEARRQGIATALVAHGLEELRRAGAGLCALEVRADNQGAVAFYRRLGFARAGLRRAYYRNGTAALVLARSIS
jgi:ribosomal-protein-alanine acetyltransferase